MSEVNIYERFAKAYADRTSPTYNNAKRTYLACYPDASEANAGRMGSRMLKDERTISAVESFRKTSLLAASLTHDDFLAFGWRVLKRSAKLLAADPKALGGFAKLYDAVGKAGGFMVTKTEDLTPLERKAPISAVEAKTLLEARLERLHRIDRPNPLPRVLATVVDVEMDNPFDDDDTHHSPDNPHDDPATAHHD